MIYVLKRHGYTVRYYPKNRFSGKTLTASDFILIYQYFFTRFQKLVGEFYFFTHIVN